MLLLSILEISTTTTTLVISSLDSSENLLFPVFLSPLTLTFPRSYQNLKVARPQWNCSALFFLPLIPGSAIPDSLELESLE